MFKKIYLGLAVAVFSVSMIVSVSCFAQGPGQGGQAPEGQAQGGEQGGPPAWMSATGDMAQAFIDAEDADKDGKVSKDEFGGPDELFTSWDKNEDGYIELSEGPTAESMKGMMGGGTPDDAPAGD